MKITNEMVERAVRSMREDFALTTECAARAALEAALKDVPEPSYFATGGFDEQAGRYHAETRAEAAEAKLAAVRAWADDHAAASHVDLSDLTCILDGED